MVFSIIQKLQLEGAKRLDAEYYQPEYLILEKILNSFGDNLKSFDEILEKGNSLTGGATPLGAEYPNNGIPFLRVQNIMPNYFNFSDIVFIDEKIHNKQLKRSRLLDNDVLLTITGVSYGKSAVYKSDFGRANINQHSVRMHFVDDMFPEYVSTFLNSKYGRFQSDRKVTGDTRPALAYEEIRKFKIPLVNKVEQQKIKKILDENNSIKEESESKYQKAEKLLLDELKIKKEAFEDKLTFITNLSDIKNARRMDADYFQPKDKALLLKLGKTKRLSDLAKRKNGSIKLVRDRLYKYTEISDVNVSNGEVLFNNVISSELPANAKIKINGGELIISKVRPTRGAIAVVPTNWNKDHVVSGAFSVFDVGSPTREYIQVVLRSIIGKLQMERPATGTSYPTITDVDVENILVPILPKTIQEKISKLVRESFESRKKAKELLEEAKRKVEEIIEKGEK